MERLKQESGEAGIALSELWLGLAANYEKDGSVDLGFACHDGTYSIDFAVHNLPLPSNADGKASAVAQYLVNEIRRYQKDHQYKFLGAGISQEVVKLSPQLPARLWSDLDIVPIVIPEKEGGSMSTAQAAGLEGVDELADSLARKCLAFFGPSSQPRVQVGFSNMVEVDCGGRARLAALQQYQLRCNERSWKTCEHYAQSLKEGNKKFAFFSATPQGGGVALMRHALVRFWRLLGVDCTWWVPKPKPEVFRVTKTNHNILQGVADPKERLTEDKQKLIDDWIQSNAERFWTRPGGPLSPRSQGGVDVVIVDDPQMPGLIDIAKKMDPDRPVIFRSHIQIRADLAEQPDTNTAGVWKWLWSSAQHANLFISHPVAAFVPKMVPHRSLAYMPATTDWLDGLNKELSDFDNAYYLHEFNTQCQRQRMNTLAFPKRDYIVQIARFDPSKGIPHVLASYAEFRRTSEFCKNKKPEETPQLVVAGHYSVDDPDGVMVLNQTLDLLENDYADVKDSVVVMRLGPTDQLLNALMSNARVALQLSTREGFEVKVSEGLKKGVPMITTKAGGIPLQVQPDKSGFLVEPGDAKAVAKYLDVLFSDEKRYDEMSKFAAEHVSDEVGTVGNAICWMYLVDKLSRGDGKLEPDGKWIWNMAREEAGQPRGEGEVWLPRDWTT
ncbi:glycosyltransferase family 4 protein [Baudoinia panamericana UAMH 10762]|uniref:Glycosyltransferase family 4 protein n=1 Tax=Baudoinia panamericana (strain UAMH 10762) TaxID=717646 RepID=M2LE69_BAUPA|nr:glycosyltransferase family 4 protein [Baudoinia panamericana UAMH 10762]EMC92277.1 glycosyltransferase family 4 protein [Baudoinia panamericana UAMH 10762]